MKRLALLFGAAGAALFVFLLAKHGFVAVGKVALSAGWMLPVIVAAHLAPVLADTLSWQALFPPDRRPKLRQLIWLRWIREGVNHLLPTARVGGDIVRARIVSWRYAPMPIAAATVIADLTSGIFTQAAFTLIGLAALLALTGSGSGLLVPILGGVAIAFGLFTGFFLVQRYGLFRLIQMLVTKLARSRSWSLLVDRGEDLDDAIRAVYRRRGDLARSMAWTMASWVLGSWEVWLALRALGHPVTILEAVAIEAVGQAVRGATFMVPGALGAQEGGLTVIGGILGVPPEQCLALSLVKRFRELTLGVPALIVWQTVEGKRLLGKRRNAKEEPEDPNHASDSLHATKPPNQ